MIEIFILLIAFQVKHLLADYYWQLPYMYENKGKTDGWIWPLGDHTTIHGILTAFMSLVFFEYNGNIESEQIILGYSLALGVLDASTHFIIDRWKATRKSQIDESQFWYNLGIDQMLHHLVGIAIIYILVSST